MRPLQRIDNILSPIVMTDPDILEYLLFLQYKFETPSCD